MLRIPYRNKLLLKKLLRIVLIILAALLVLSLVLLLYYEPYIVYDRDGAHLRLSTDSGQAAAPEAAPRPTVENPLIVYDTNVPTQKSLVETGGYYITTAMLQDPEAVFDAVKKLEEPCAVMIELKSIFGNFYYSTSIGGAQKAEVMQKLSQISGADRISENCGRLKAAVNALKTDFAVDTEEMLAGENWCEGSKNIAQGMLDNIGGLKDWSALLCTLDELKNLGAGNVAEAYMAGRVTNDSIEPAYICGVCCAAALFTVSSDSVLSDFGGAQLDDSIARYKDIISQFEELTVKELAAKLSAYMVFEGADTQPYGNILISGPNTSLLHGIPSDRALRYGDFVLMDYGCQFNGYMSDMTRTVVVGKATDEQKCVYALEKQMIEDSLAVMKAGADTGEVYRASIKAIENTEYRP